MENRCGYTCGAVTGGARVAPSVTQLAAAMSARARSAARTGPSHLALLACAAVLVQGALAQSAGGGGAPRAPAWANAAPRGEDIITLVTTGDELNAAIERGDAHIEIIEHLDLSALPERQNSFGHELFWPRPSTLTIRVRVHLPLCRAHLQINADDHMSLCTRWPVCTPLQY